VALVQAYSLQSMALESRIFNLAQSPNRLRARDIRNRHRPLLGRVHLLLERPVPSTVLLDHAVKGRDRPEEGRDAIWRLPTATRVQGGGHFLGAREGGRENSFWVLLNLQVERARGFVSWGPLSALPRCCFRQIAINADCMIRLTVRSPIVGKQIQIT
jgi:hypothetical protein